jgi:hypothetical protein
MLKFHRKVNPKEGLLGVYITAKELNEQGIAIVNYFQEQIKQQKSKALISFPLIMMVDPTLQENKLSIKVRFLIFLLDIYGKI